MKKRNMVVFIALTLCCLIVFSGCRAGVSIPEPGGLVVNSLSTGLGGADDSLDKSELSYEIYLTNNEASAVDVQSAEIVFGESIRERILGGGEPVELNRTIQPGETVTISGSVTFDTKGMSKEEIEKLEPFLRDLKIVREQTIQLLRKED